MTHLAVLPVVLICLSLPAQVNQSTAARDQLDHALGEQDPGRPTPTKGDPLLPIIAKLDLGYHQNQQSPAWPAYVELLNLGVLAVPSLYGALDDLGPFGLNAALELLVRHPDQRMTAALDRLLRSADTSRQIVAARLMARLPLEIVRPLAAIARSSEVPEVQVAGLAVQSRDGMRDAELAAELLPLTKHRRKALRLEILGIIGDRTLPGRAFLPVLEELTQPRSEDFSDPASAALQQWARRIGDGGEAAAIELFDDLEDVRSRFDLIDALRSTGRLPWTKFYVHAATHLPPEKHSSLLWALSKAPHRDIPDDVLNKLLAADKHMQYDFGTQALDFVMATRRPSMADEVGRIMLDPEVPHGLQKKCLAWLSEVAPAVLVDNASQLLQGSVRMEAAEFFASVDEPRVVRPAVDALLRSQSNDIVFEPLTSVVSYRSTAGDLDAVLDLVSHPLDGSTATDGRVAAARRALHRWLAPRHLPAAFTRLFDMHESVAADILRRAAEIATPAQRDAVTALLRTCLDNWKAPAAYSGPVISSAEAGVRAIDILRHLGGEADAAILFELLDAPRADVREAGFAALLAMDAATRRRALTLALQRDGDPFEALQYRDVGQDPELRRLATDRLLAGAFARSKSVGRFLDHCPEADRIKLIDALLRQAEKRVDTAHVADALVALGRLQREGAEAELGQWMRSEDPAIRKVAIEQLGGTYSPAAVPFLLEALKDESITNRTLAAEALARFETFLNEKARWKALLERDK